MDQLRKTVYLMLFITTSIAVLHFTKDLLMPLALAALLAMLFSRLSNKLEARGWRRWMTALLSVAVFLSSVGIIIGLLSWQLSSMIENVTEMREQFTSQLSAFRDWLHTTVGINHSQQEEIVEEQTQSASNEGGSGIATFAIGTLGVLFDTVLVVVYTFLLLLYRARIKTFIIGVTPEKYKDKSSGIIQDASGVAQQYLIGLTAMIGVLWVLYGIGFSIAGVEGALFFAVLCGVLEIIPFVGNLLGTTITVLAVIVQGGDTNMILAVVGIYMAVQGIQTYVLEPLIVGNQVNINPLFIIIALIAGELLWGIAGMIMAIPLLGIIKIICDRITPLKPYGLLIGDEKVKKKK